MSLNLILSVPASINPEGVQVRTVGEPDSPLFCLMDVCKALNLEQVSRVAHRLCDDEVTQSKVIDALGREQSVLFVTEAGFYRVVMRSDKPTAAVFSRWVCHEVLPCIRKHGCYPAPAQQDATPGVLTQLVAAVGQILDRLVRLEERTPTPAPQFVPTGGAIGIMEQVRRLWRSADQKQRNRCVARIQAVCNNKGIRIWKPLDNGPLAMQECDAYVINDVVCEIRELGETPLFNRFARQTAMSN